MSLFVNPAQFDDASDLAAYPRDEARDLAIAEAEGVDVVFAPDAGELYPRRLRDVGRARPHRRGGRGAARPLPRRRDGVPQALQHRPPGARVLRPEGRAAGRRDPPARPRPQRPARDPRRADRARRRRPRALVPQRPPLGGGARARARPAAGADTAPSARPIPSPPPAPPSTASPPTTSRLVDLDGATVLAAAVRVGSTRLIDNVLLEGDLA